MSSEPSGSVYSVMVGLATVTSTPLVPSPYGSEERRAAPADQVHLILGECPDNLVDIASGVADHIFAVVGTEESAL